MSSTTQSPAEMAKDLATTEPRTLWDAREILAAIAEIQVSAPITHAAQLASSGPTCVRTLPQAKEALKSISTMLESAASPNAVHGSGQPNATGAADLRQKEFVERRQAWRDRMAQKRSAAPSPAAATVTPASDSALLDRYSALKGPARFAFFQANRDALVREDRRRADAAKTAVHADIVSQYLALTGKARADFLEKHSAELWEAHRARSRGA